MNLQYIRYALEIARTGSISKAAENLSVAQPNLSRAVKELETGLGIAIFERTRTGMAVTPDGERLLSVGERILREVGEMETMFEGDAIPREALSIVFPYADYMSQALSALVSDLPVDGRYDLSFCEVGPMDAMSLVASGESRLGILRFPAHNERYYTDRLAERELAWEKVARLPVVVLTAAVFSNDRVGHAELDEFHRVKDGSLPDAAGETETIPHRRMTVNSPISLLRMLRADPSMYALTLPLTSKTLEAEGLHQYAISDADLVAVGEWEDVLIYPKFYRLSSLDRRLLERLEKSLKE